MLTRLETKSNRVKGLSFHPNRPWILASLHNGQIQLWDYRMKTLLDTFEEHNCPVRGIAFHPSQPLFVSGGDDYKVKVWNYKQRKCIFTLLGHADYVRSVKFHNEYPWILSASDDQTIRIWNWQSRECISVMTGHNHYVMYAEFHPSKDLVLSCSLDQTIRVWDVSSLRKKKVNGTPGDEPEGSVISRVNSDLFGVSKFVLEGHDRCVNFANFHPTLNLIVSGSDDRQIKLWRYNDTRVWEVDTIRGHVGNVSNVMFHPTRNLIISDSEDHTIRVWDATKRVSVQKFTRPFDRYWALALHPEQDLMAAGHDSGFVVFKLSAERPPADHHGSSSYYVKEKYIRSYTYSGASTSNDNPLLSLTSNLQANPRSLEANPYDMEELSFLLTCPAEGGSYEIYRAPANERAQVPDPVKGFGLGVTFTARNRICVLEKDHKLTIRSLDNQLTKPVTPPQGMWTSIFPGGGSGRVLLRSDDKVIIFETTSRRVLGSHNIRNMKYVCWDASNQYVALLGKDCVTICSKDLTVKGSSQESIGVKRGTWDPRGAFVYSTLGHIKYLIPGEEGGVIRSLDYCLYLNHVDGYHAYGLDRERRVKKVTIDPTEYLFKIYLCKHNIPEVTRILQSGRLSGQNLVKFLKDKDYAEVALHFVQDKETRLELALQCGNFDVAMEVAMSLDKEEYWNLLGAEALRRGRISITEMSYQKTKNFEKLSFLYLITGNMEKLEKMLKISELRGNSLSLFQNALYLGDAACRVKALMEAGEVPLAYITAFHYGLEEAFALCKEKLEKDGLSLPELPVEPCPLRPPAPLSVIPDTDVLPPPKSFFDQICMPTEPAAPLVEDAMSPVAGASSEETKAATEEEDEPQEDGTWDNDDLNLDLSDVIVAEKKAEMVIVSGSKNQSTFFFIHSMSAPSASWGSSSTAATLVAIPQPQLAMDILHRQIGAMNFEAFLNSFTQITLGSRVYTHGFAHCPPLSFELLSKASEFKSGQPSLPSPTFLPSHLVSLVQDGYKLFHAGKFQETKDKFSEVFGMIPLVGEGQIHGDDLKLIKSILSSCREYCQSCLLELKRKETEDPVQKLELVCYLTQCTLQPSHMLLALNLAMAQTFKMKNFINSADFARKILESPEIQVPKNAALKDKATKVLQQSEVQARNEVDISFSPSEPKPVCMKSFRPLVSVVPVKCPYCYAQFHPSFKGQLCTVCQISQIGEQTIGLVLN